MSKMLTAKDIQEMLQVDQSTIYRMADDGRLPAIKVGRQWRFPQDAVARFLASGEKRKDTVSPSSPSGEGKTIWPIECTQLLLDAFADLLGVMLVLTDLDGHPITEVSNSPPYYQLMQQTEKGHDLCLEVWGKLGQMHALEPRFISTFAGLLCARALIRVGNELKGMVIAFGIAPQDWTLTSEIREEISKIMEEKEERYIESFQAIRPLSPAEQNQVLETLQRIGDILAHITDERSDLITRLQKISQLSSFEDTR